MNSINYYVITLSTRERLENIEYQKNKFNLDIKKFDGVDGNKLDLKHLINKKRLCEKYKNNTLNIGRNVGCYYSHINLYKKIKNESNETGYSIIFEDDFDIRTNNFNAYIFNILDNVANSDFDIIYLGYLYNSVGEKYKDNLYYPDKNVELLCTHAYIINNSSIDKFLSLLSYIDMPIDNKLDKAIKQNKLKALVAYPSVVFQKGASIINS